jgi:glutamine amidotransferase
MCRWIAYRGRDIALENYVTLPEHSLTAQSLAALESTASTNGDGFGLGWYGQHPEPGLYHETRPAWSDENLRYLCRHLHSHLFFAHVRAATGTAVTRQNCHPFANGHWMFRHNGFIGSWNRLRRKVENLIPDALYPSRIGTTDSEAVFLAMMGAGLDADALVATEATLGLLCALVNEDGRRERLRFTSALTNGRDLYAFRFAENDTANSLYYREESEPLDRIGFWNEMPPNHALIAKHGCAADLVSFSPSSVSQRTQERTPSTRVVARQ